MKQIKEFKVFDQGIISKYYIPVFKHFDGDNRVNTGVNKEYSCVMTGQGKTFAEAFDDAITGLTICDYDTSSLKAPTDKSSNADVCDSCDANNCSVMCDKVRVVSIAIKR
jgi:hypothetical protein